MDYRSIIESKYSRESWLALLHDIFKSGTNFRTVPIAVDANSNIASSAVQLGTITLADDNKIAVYEIKLSDSVDIVANRVGIRNLLISDWKMKGCVGAFMFCFRDNESVLRFSYVSSSFQFTEEGKLEKSETDTKRYTYLLGAGHRSRTAIKQFEDLKNSKLMLADLTKAFSIEALSDRFFKDYKDIYEDIIEHVTGKRIIKVANKWEEKVMHKPDEIIMNEFSWFDDPEKAVRDYVKKLMGRIVFLQFIQKKGWLGVPVGKDWGEGDKEFLQNLYDCSENKDNFIDGTLEFLFNDINTKRDNDLAHFVVGRDIKVPYLNGGLFEQDKADNCTFRLPKKLMDKMFLFFSSYNFTIDENDPDDAEIGVDPEMLGRIFENLLEDNKDKGAFYTPKEIVQYMCRESLIAYLQTGEEDDRDVIRAFVTSYNKSVLDDQLLQRIKTKLINVKICDPAIGSGAFPMGLLKELFACRSAIEGLNNDNASEIKKHIIQNNIYGVDIEKGAVDIARLRFWLALIVDEKTPHALPNMDFKIMQGNSLIPTFNGKYVNLSDKLRHVNSNKIRDAKKELFGLQTKYYDSEGDEKKSLLIRINYLILEIVKLQMDYEYRAEVEKNAQTIDLFNQEIKQVLVDQEKAAVIGQCLRFQQQLGNTSKSINERSEISIPFFDWKIMFSDILQLTPDNNGFDILISNPPYIKELDNKRVFDSLAGSDIEKKYHVGKMDYWYYFLHKGMELCKSSAIICFITSRYWIKNKGAKKLIKSVKANLSFISILDIGSLKVFDNVVGHHMVSMFQNICDSSINCEYKKVSEKIENIPLGIFEDSRILVQDNIITSGFEINIEAGANYKSSHTLEDYFDISQGVVEASDKISAKMYKRNPNPNHFVGEGIFVLTQNELNNLQLSESEKTVIVKYLGDGDIDSYCIHPVHTKYLIYSDESTRNKIKQSDEFRNLKHHLDRMSTYITSSNRPYGLHRARTKSSFTSPKIICPSMFKEPVFAFDENAFFCGMSYNVMTLKPEISDSNYLFGILGILNSSFAKEWFYKNAKHRGVGVDVGVSKLREFPIPDIPNLQELSSIVKNILYNIQKGDKCSELINNLDRMVVTLYE